jgi:hypothetical protein
MANKLLIILLFPVVSFAQDTLYSLPISKARLLFHDAMRSYVQDELLVLRENRISSAEYLLSKAQFTMSGITQNYENQLILERQKYEACNVLSERYRKDLRRARRGNRWLKVALPVGIVGAFVLAQ